MSTGIQIRHYRQGDEGQLNELFRTVFGVQRPLEGWYWKFRDNAVFDRILISVAEREDGLIVGMYPLLVMEYQVRDELFLAVQSVEISIHPDYRGRWIVKRLKSFVQQTAIESGMRFGFGFPTREHAKVGIHFMGYSLLGELPILGISIVRGFKVKGRIVRGVLVRLAYLIRLVHLYLRVTTWAKKEREGNGGFQLVELEGFSEDFDRLWKNVSADYPVIAHRSSRYLNWRYVDNPMADFTVIGAKRNGSLIGYLVFTSLMEGGVRNGIIFDFICRKTESGGKLLLREGLLKLLRRRVKSIRCGALPHTSLYRYLISLGFVKWESSPVVNFEALDERLDAVTMSDLGAWYLSIGDTDLLGW